MPLKRQPRPDAGTRFSIGGYYLDCPHPDRGGCWYACRYDAGARKVRRKSLGETDFEKAKIALAALVALAPARKAEGESAPAPGQVLTVAALKAYMDGRGAQIVSQESAERAGALFTGYLEHIDKIDAPVSFWTPSQQIACAFWLHKNYTHSAGTIARLFNVMRSAFRDAAAVQMRADVLGNPVEARLIDAAPKIIVTRERAAKELQIPARAPRKATVTLDQMAAMLDALNSEHLFRFAMLSLCTWARPQAVIDFDPHAQAHWTDGSIDLAPIGWVQTKKRRPRQPMSLALAGWLSRWTQEDDRRRREAKAAGELPKPDALLIYKRAKVGTVKQAFRRIGRDLGIPGFSQYSFRHFMADQAKKNFRLLAREQRSRWLGHKIRDGSQTTTEYESDDPHDIADVALATDCIVALLNERCSRDLFAIETRLNYHELQSIGARVMPKDVLKSRKNGGRDRDRTCDPLHVKVIRLADFLANPAKRRA